MNFELTAEQILIQKEIRAFAERELNQDVISRDRNSEFRRDLWEKCAAIGLQGLPIPEQYGGSGLDPVSTALAIESFGEGCKDGGLVFSVCAHLLACVVPVWKFGTEEQKQKWLPSLLNGKWIAVNGMTEPASGSDAFNMKTTATKTEGGYLLNGNKIFASNGPVADVALVYASTDKDKGYHGGTTAFLIKKGDNGFKAGQSFEKMGLRTCPIGELVFENTFVKDEDIIGKPGGGGVVFNHSMEWERICLVAAHVGTMQRILNETVTYAKSRQSGGKSIGNYQAVAHTIANMKTRLEASKWLVYQAASKLDNNRTVGLDASIVKLFVSESFSKSATEALQVLAGYGYMVEYEIERVVRDAAASTIYSGTSDIQKNIIAKWMGLRSDS